MYKNGIYTGHVMCLKGSVPRPLPTEFRLVNERVGYRESRSTDSPTMSMQRSKGGHIRS